MTNPNSAESLTAEQLDAIERGCEGGIDLQPSTILSLVAMARRGLEREWRCFHCDEVFTDEHCAREHFGKYENQVPACQIKGSDRGLLGALREAENDAADAWHAVLSESTDAAKSYFSQNNRHQRQLREVEQIGYERGLADAKAHPETLGLYAAPLNQEREGLQS